MSQIYLTPFSSRFELLVRNSGQWNAKCIISVCGTRYTLSIVLLVDRWGKQKDWEKTERKRERKGEGTWREQKEKEWDGQTDRWRSEKQIDREKVMYCLKMEIFYPGKYESNKSSSQKYPFKYWMGMAASISWGGGNEKTRRYLELEMTETTPIQKNSKVVLLMMTARLHWNVELKFYLT